MMTEIFYRAHNPQWTQDEAIAFEAAREGIGHVMAIYSTEIAEEQAQAQPDLARVENLRGRRRALISTRNNLRVESKVEIASVLLECGSIVRARNERRNRAESGR